MNQPAFSPPRAPRHILVATDLSESADEALQQAHRLARHFDSRMSICHVMPNWFAADPLFPEYGQDALARIPAIREKAHAAVRARVAQITGRNDDDYVVSILDGTVHRAIVDEGVRLGVDLVLVGSHGRRGLTHFLMGSVAEQVARNAACSVLVSRQSPKTGRVIAAVAEGDESDFVVGLATRWVRPGGTLAVAHAIEPVAFGFPEAYPYLTPAITPTQDAGRLRVNAGRELEAKLAAAGVRGEPIILEGEPRAAIADYAKQSQAELVVVGSAGRKGLGRWAFGSVSEGIVRNSPCSVLVGR